MPNAAPSQTLVVPGRGHQRRAASDLSNGPGCPSCGNPRIWTSWIGVADTCPSCHYELSRHGWLAAVWINTWIAIVLVMSWNVGGLIATGGAGPWWVTAGGIALAITTPPLTYRYAKAAMLRLLFKLDPSEENTHDR